MRYIAIVLLSAVSVAVGHTTTGLTLSALNGAIIGAAMWVGATLERRRDTA